MKLSDFIYNKDQVSLRSDSALAKMVESGKEKPLQRWHTVDWTVEEDGGLIVVDRTRPPFDEKPVLIMINAGIIQANWIPPIWLGEEYDGFFWIDGFEKEHELDDVSAWHPLPEIERPLTELESFDPYAQGNGVLIHTRNNEWVEAWFDKEFNIWQAMDADFTVSPKEVTGWSPLPDTKNLPLLFARSYLDEIKEHPAVRNFRETLAACKASDLSMKILGNKILEHNEDLRDMFDCFQRQIERFSDNHNQDMNILNDPEMKSLNEGIAQLPNFFQKVALERAKSIECIKTHSQPKP
ncbi:hypothetical protein ACSSZE_03275 [Acidithiobacillus caldus]